MADMWLFLAIFGLGFGCLAVLNWLRNRWKNHKQLSEWGTKGQAIRQQKELLELQSQVEEMKQEKELGTDLMQALVKGAENHQAGKKPLENVVSVVKEHPGAAWFIVKKILSGEIDPGALVSKVKGIGLPKELGGD